ncbi:C-C motif chemokine 3-like, partial [Clarias magur]
AHGPSRCCFNYQKKEISKQKIKAYKKTMHQCTKPGVIHERSFSPVGSGDSRLPSDLHKGQR